MGLVGRVGRVGLVGLAVCLASGLLLARADFPKPVGFVNDFAQILDAPTREALDQQLTSVEKETKAEIVLVTVPSLDGMTVEEYANKLFKEWGIGKKKEDNGVLVLVAPAEREMRIEVGYGLEGVLPDGLAGEIIRNEFTPRFKNGDYPGGISNGIKRVADVVRANHVMTPDERKAMASSGGPPLIFLVPFFGIFIAIGSLAIGAGVRAKMAAPLLFGAMFTGIPSLMSLIFAPLSTIFLLLPLGILMMIWGYRIGANKLWVERATSGRGGSGWRMGGGGGGGSWRSGGGSSGGSFGGGSSGGGGASGKW